MTATADSITIAHLADLHFGYSLLNLRRRNGQNVREHDFARAALACAEHIAERKPDLILIAGDLLQSTRISSTGLNAAIAFCRTLSAAAPTVVIGGNHDEAGAAGRFSDLRICANHGGVQLVSEQTHVDVAGVRVHCAPFRVIERAVRRSGNGLEPFEFSSQLPNVLMAHAYAPGENIPAPPEGEEVEIPADWLTDTRFTLRCLGHIHRHVRHSPATFYAGSVERRDFGERDETAGFWMHTLSDGQLTSSESILVSELAADLPRPMIQIDIAADRLTVSDVDARVREILTGTDIDGALIKLVVTNVTSELDRTRARNDWLAVAREHGALTVETDLRTRELTELFDVQFDGLPVNVADAFQAFLAEQHFDSDHDRRLTLTMASDTMASAHERLIAEDA